MLTPIEEALRQVHVPVLLPPARQHEDGALMRAQKQAKLLQRKM